MENDDMPLINKFTRKELEKDQVYIFPVTLCDNEIDRDFEKFTGEALSKLCPLFEGKTGIFDHNMRSSDQTARIFKTWVETDEDRKNSLGEPYQRLCAKAYMVRTKENEALIEEIEGGIKKEVSISCSAAEITCSVCGKEMRSGQCEHRKGRQYGETLCYGILSSPTDAYEWSFVAVPSQRAAGITKAFHQKEENNTDIFETIKSCDGDITLTKAQAEEIAKYISALEGYESDAKAFRTQLLSSIEKNALIVMPKVNVKSLMQGFCDMSAEKLQLLEKGFKAQAEEIMPRTLQLSGEKTEKKADNAAFKI